MAQQTRGELIKAARMSAKLTQEKLAQAVGVTAADISKAERGDIDLTDAVLKRIAKETGVTQASLIGAPMGGTKTAAAPAKTTAKTTNAKTTAARTTPAKTTPAKTTPAKTTTAKATGAKATTAKANAPKTPANADVSMKVTSTEKKLIEYYRGATSDQKKAATRVLKGECDDMLTTLVNGGAGSGAAEMIGDFLTNLLGGK